MRPRARREAVVICLLWLLALIVSMYILRYISKVIPDKHTSCPEFKNFKSTTGPQRKSDGGLKKVTVVARQSGNEDLFQCYKSLAAVRRLGKDPQPDNVVPDDMVPGRENYHKKYWPPKATPNDKGYGGLPVVIDRNSLNDREKQILDEGYTTYKVNQLVTDMIPLRRELHTHTPECSRIKYDTKSLPQAGVVVIFYNELWSVLLRTVFSILDATPDDLLTEIILVDDYSDKEHLGKPLEDYLTMFYGKVKLVRLPQKMGLIQARMTGFDHVTGEVAVFLDAHTEVHKGWLEPLLHRIHEDNSVLAVPVTNVIDSNTFECEFSDNYHIGRGGFDFDMTFTWIPDQVVDGVKRKNLVDPVKSPTHPGCCFAVYKDTFERLGRYDPDLQTWGCENLELSFKTWMCGGSVEIIPCSHIAHMYRASFPYSTLPDFHETLLRNCIRVAEVWLDEYKQIYYDRIDQIQKKMDKCDISERLALREKLKCRSFDWYVKEVYPELYLPLNTSASGLISSAADQNICASIEMRGTVDDLNPQYCDPQSQTQHFILSKESQIRRDQGCLLWVQDLMRVVLELCDADRSRWSYTKDNNIVVVDSGLCLTLSVDKSVIMMVPCRKDNKFQQWIWPRKSVVLFK